MLEDRSPGSCKRHEPQSEFGVIHRVHDAMGFAEKPQSVVITQPKHADGFKRAISNVTRKSFGLIFACFSKPITLKSAKKITSENDAVSIADDATLASVEPIGFTKSEDSGFARTLEIIYAPDHGDDQLKYGAVVFDSGSTHNFITVDWLRSNRVPFESFSDGPRVVARSFQGAQITAIGKMKNLRFGRPRNQSPIEDAAGNEINLKWRFWQGDFYILDNPEMDAGDELSSCEPVEIIVGAETIRYYDLYRPSPLLMMGSGSLPAPSKPVDTGPPKTT